MGNRNTWAAPLAAVVTGTLLLSATAAAEVPLRTSEADRGIQALTGPDAKFYARKVLIDRYASFANGYNREIGPCKKLSRVRQRCKAKWLIGDLGYFGYVTISYRRGNNEDFFYSLDLKFVNYYCISQGESRSACTETAKPD